MGLRQSRGSRVRYQSGARLWTAALFAVAMIAAGPAGAAPVHTEHLTVELAPQTTAAAPGGTVYVALHQKIKSGWHTYWRNPGDSGQATEIKWTLPPGWKAGPIVWPAPHRFATGPLMNYVYSDEVYLPVPIEVPADAKTGSTADLKAHANFLVCSDVCVPEEADVSLSLPVTSGTPAPDPTFGAAITDTLAKAPKAVGLAAAYTQKDGVLQLAVAGDPLRGIDLSKTYFFPYDGAVIDHSKPQMAVRGDSGLTYTLVAGFGFQAPMPPTEVAGVVMVGDQGYELDAKPGPPPPGSTGSGTPVKVGTGLASGAAVLPSVAGTTPAAATPSSAPAGPGMGLLAAIGLAFVGGLILNLMPCVFPVLSIKAAALVRQGGAPAQARVHGLVFMAGVVATFLALAALLIAARAGGEAVGWGFQLQNPSVVAGLALLMLVVGLNLSGVFEFGLSAQGAGTGLANKSGLAGAFFTGALAVVVAAPCTAPFMAGAIGWAVTQPPAAALLVFASLGLGLAAPFTILSFIPALFRRLPRPGGWMDVLRQVLAFPMYAAAGWLAWVFSLQSGPDALPFLFAAAVTLAFAAWAWGASQKSEQVWPPRIAAVLAFAAAVPLAVVGARMSPAPAAAETASTSASAAAAGAIRTESWSPERVATLRAAGKPVFVDFTAAWCVTCQVNERTALNGAKVAEAFASTGATYLKADWTNRNADIAKALTAQGRSGVPLYLVYGPTGDPKILPQLLTEGMVVEALKSAAGPAA